ncbi:lytic polysaccharide monooxygenase, partial [bacterium AH-315-K03]|nr:lytic polysaccharide monooxygenase [bacterium AH-315-K03]
MLFTSFKNLGCTLLLLLFSASVFSHGMIENPGARNYYCGYITKPDEVINGVAEYPECGGAFAEDPSGGYQFMSVLSHTEGRAVVSPLPSNVCGFDSETWQGGKTPWDMPIDWPVNDISAGRQVFTWNITWGPHFGDTSDFRYWITKSDFQFQVGQALTWDDFESTTFCSLDYNDDTPNANPDVIPEPNNALFHTYCTVPARSGRHVIYVEWGREPPTYERFHGCVD